MNENTNCLSGMKCPRCESLEPFLIAGTAVFTVYDSGTKDCSDVVWDEFDMCECVECGLRAMVKSFKVPKP